MADINLIETYMPDFSELTQEELYDTRERLEQYIRVKFDDIDLDPNTVVGDLIISPQTYTIAAMEKGLSRFTSDLDLGNVANDVIWNCDFVEQYLKNFGVDNTGELKPSGVVRLVFSANEPDTPDTANKTYILDRSVKFAFGSESNIFSAYLPNLGPYYILPVGSDREAGTNTAVLRDTGSDAYFADIPIVGDTGALDTDILAGSSGLISVEIPELIAVTALVDFDKGSDESSLPELAKRARTTIYSSSLNTRTGAIRYITSTCPFVESVYALHNGDKEMIRTFRNPFGAASGCMDVYVRSKSYEFVEEQVVRLTLEFGEDEETPVAFTGDWEYVGQPYYIESITHPDSTSPNLECTITSTNDAGLGALAAYSPQEKLHISVPYSEDYRVSIDSDGVQSTQFVIRYRTDPALRAIAQTVENADHRPVNTSIFVRGFIPVIIKRFEVVYVREPGVLPELDTARDEIKAYLGGLGAPDAYSDGVIADIMKAAGVKYMVKINVLASIQWSVADKIANFAGELEPVPASPEIGSSADLRVSYPKRELNANDMYACSIRNVRYYAMEGAVSFKEVKEM